MSKWTMAHDGRILFDGAHRADVKITVDGNWEDDDERREYSLTLAAKLNGPDDARVGHKP